MLPDLRAKHTFLDLLRAHAVVVDLADVTYIDSSGVDALLRIRNAALEHHQTIRLRHPPQPALPGLDITDLDSLLAIDPDRRTGPPEHSHLDETAG